MQYAAHPHFTRNRAASRGDSRSGQILIVFVVAITIVAGSVALMLDGGRIYWEKRMAQNAADAAAMAGGHELRRGNDLTNADVVSWITDDGELYGFQASEIQILYPPATGSNAGNTQFVEAVVSRDVPLMFMRFFGWSTANVKGRATAGLQSGGHACMIALNNDPTQDGMRFNGSGNFNADCGLMTNSTDPDAMRNVGSGRVSATWVGVTGGYSGGGTINPSPTLKVPPMLDPLEGLAELDPATLAPGSSSTSGGVTTWTAGTYPNGIKITGGTHVFSAGNYYLGKGIQVTGGDITGSEVFFYNGATNKNFGIEFTGNGLVTLSAPTSGTYQGVLFFGNPQVQNKTNLGGSGNKILRGNASSSFQGSLYFPSQDLDWAGNPLNSNKWSLVIADEIDVSGNTDMELSGPPSSGGPPAYTAVLFE